MDIPRTLLLGVIAAMASLLAAPSADAQARGAGNAVQRREDRVDPDRWNRVERTTPLAGDDPDGLGPLEADSDDDSEGDEEDEDADEDGRSKKPRRPVAPHHRGELNGKLRLGEW